VEETTGLETVYRARPVGVCRKLTFLLDKHLTTHI